MSNYGEEQINTIWYGADGNNRYGIPILRELINLAGKQAHLKLLAEPLSIDDDEGMNDLAFMYRRVYDKCDDKGFILHEAHTWFINYMNRFFRKCVGEQSDMVRQSYKPSGERKGFFRKQLRDFGLDYNLSMMKQWAEDPDANTFEKYVCIPKTDKTTMLGSYFAQNMFRIIRSVDHHNLLGLAYNNTTEK